MALGISPVSFAGDSGTRIRADRSPLNPNQQLPSGSASAAGPAGSTRDSRMPIKVTVPQPDSMPVDQQPISLPATAEASSRIDKWSGRGTVLNLEA